MTRSAFLVCAALLYLCLGAVEVHAATLAGPVVNPANGHSYTMLTASSWTDAEAEAVSMGGHLATVRSLAENDWLRPTFQPFDSDPSASLLIGFTDAAQEGTFVWTSSEAVTFTNWASGEPNNQGGGAGEDYTNLLFQQVGVIQPGQWNDINTGSSALPQHGVVEIVPEPGTFILGFMSVMTLCIRRRKLTCRPPATGSRRKRDED